MTPFAHVTVLAAEAVAALAPRDGGVYVDCTLGGGGHAEGLLQAADCRVIGLDRDPNALRAANARLAGFGGRFQSVHARFSELGPVLAGLGLDGVDGVLADLGVSSPQLDQPERGFSFRTPGPIDMRMDPTAGVSAAELVNSADQDELADWIYLYGEERAARRVARAIVAGRPWADTATLAAAIAEVVGRGSGIHPATRTFQALRIVVNDELGEIRRLLPAAVDLLRPDGRLAIIAFHSLEDRIVKHYFQEQSGRTAPRDPFGNPVGPLRLRLLPPVAPSPSDPNPRARSARLRAAVRLPWNAS
jgi:16S rRNA (cytosine1402-N4)-methyltransferase